MIPWVIGELLLDYHSFENKRLTKTAKEIAAKHSTSISQYDCGQQTDK